MDTVKTDVTYVFGFGRANLLNSNSIFAKEFFYSYFEIKKKFKNVNYIEFENNIDKNISNSIFNIISRLLRKITKLSFFFDNICNYQNFKTLSKTKNIILTNDRIGLSLLPFLLIFKLFKINKSTVIVMGLLAKQTNNLFSHFLQRVFLNIFFIVVDNFMFLSKGEYVQAKTSYKKYRNKFSFTPFCVDTKFWNVNNYEPKNKNIVFVGNDGRREYDLVLQIAQRLTEYNFTLVTSNLDLEDIKTKNIKLINGHWNKQVLNDTELKNIYSESSLSIIPIKNSYQPSGQSVALQSMSVGVPVMITYTDGFWDKDLFKNNENILFVNNNTVDHWVNAIKDTLSYNNKLKQLSLNAKKTVFEKYDLKIFFEELLKVLKRD